MMNIFLAALAFAQAPATQPPAPGPGSVEIFGDWAVGCDNGWTCEALSLSSEDWSIGSDASLTVRRAGGPDGHPRVGVRVYEEIRGDTVALHIDGRHAATLTDSGDGLRFEVDPGMARVILPHIATASQASLQSAAGDHLFDISLTGSAAALRYIDDRQQRAGTRGAAIAIGEGLDAAVPEPSAIPVVRAMPIAARAGDTSEPVPASDIRELYEARECDFSDAAPTANIHIISDAAELVLIPCSRGAYNFSDIAFIRYEDGIGPARFDEVFSWGDDAAIPLLVNTHWDAEAMTLNTFAKGRGLGDCGTAESFVWDGFRFRLIERREMNSCRGSVHWITVYRAGVEWVQP